MAESVYKVIELVGTSTESWEKAATAAVNLAAQSLRDLRVAEVTTLDMQLEVAATYFDRELESRIKRFTTMFEPIMIIFVGVIVGFVALALVSAMYGVLGGLKETA